LITLQKVQQSARRGDDDFHTFKQIPLLRTLWRTAVDTSGTNTTGATDQLNLLLHLDRQLTSGSQTKDDRSITSLQSWLMRQMDHGRHQKRERFPGTSLSDAHEITPTEGDRPRHALNRRWMFKPEFVKGVHYVVGDGEFVEREDGFGDFVSGDCDLLGGEELGNVMLGSIRHARMLLVKILVKSGHALQVEGRFPQPDSWLRLAKFWSSIAKDVAASSRGTPSVDLVTAIEAVLTHERRVRA